MAVFKVELDQETYEQLVTLAFRECRPPAWHIEWLLRKAIQEETTRIVPPKAGGPYAERVAVD